MKQFLLTLLAVWILGTAVSSSSLQAQTLEGQTIAQSTNNGKVNADQLREMLTKGLKATRDDQKKYIDVVVARAVKKTLPLSVVYASFKYARTRRPSYPFPYFVYSVETLSKRKR